MNNRTINAINERAISAFPLSIGTSLIFESIFDGKLPPYDPERPIPNRIDIKKYDKHWFNINTLIRNLYGSIKHKDAVIDHPGDLAYTLKEEVDIIINIYNSPEAYGCKPHFINPDYKNILKNKTISYRDPNRTNKKSQENSFLLNVLDIYIKQYDEALFKLPNNNLTLPKSSKRELITTHHAIDLLSVKENPQLELLESHTGRLKNKLKFNSKYNKVGSISLDNIPFNEKLLYFFGDKTLIQPYPIKLRHELISIAKEKKWTPITTNDKIIFNIKSNAELSSVYNALPTYF